VIVYAYSEARQKLATVLDQVLEQGGSGSSARLGRFFIIRAEPREGSPLDVPGIDVPISADEIVQFVEKGRQRYG